MNDPAHRKIDETDAERERDAILRRLLETPPQPRPKRKRAKQRKRPTQKKA